MLAPEKQAALETLIRQSSADEWLWMSGYLAALATGRHAEAPPATSPTTLARTITVVYGTETGNSKRVATQLTARLKQQGHRVKLAGADTIDPARLTETQILLFVVSTQGEGEPPAQARKLYEFLHATEQGLPQLQFAVLALGSRSYPLFCQAGIDFDTQLRRLQAKPLLPLTMADDDFEPVAEAWTGSVSEALGKVHAPSPQPAAKVNTPEGKKYFRATLGRSILLNDRGSNKAVYHLEFDLPEPLAYTPGNAVGIVPRNNPETVRKLLELLGLKPGDMLSYKGEAHRVEDLLRDRLSVTYLSQGVLRKYAALVQADIPDTRMDLYDLLRIYPLPDDCPPQHAIELLNPITPRLYTIASSPNAHPGQLHLTVEKHSFEHNGQRLDGFASGFLASMKPGTQAEWFLHRQKNFQLPPTGRHLILIGQGTGMAPLRSMIAERDATGCPGQNWLLFGEEDFVTDFYYQTEIQAWQATGSLHRVDLAFRRNRNQSRTVADLVRAQGRLFWQWLELGAYVMLSGEKEPMGKEVEQAITEVIAAGRGAGEADAARYLRDLAREGRFAKELY